MTVGFNWGEVELNLRNSHNAEDMYLSLESNLINPNWFQECFQNFNPSESIFGQAHSMLPLSHYYAEQWYSVSIVMIAFLIGVIINDITHLFSPSNGWPYSISKYPAKHCTGQAWIAATSPLLVSILGLNLLPAAFGIMTAGQVRLLHFLSMVC